MVWATQTVAVKVASFGQWGDDSLADNITIINSRWRLIMKEVCDKHQVGILEIRSHRRAYRIIRARHELFYRLRMETALSLAQIGQRVGGFDHSTTLSGIKCHEKRLAEGTAI
jgi:chromosomal replication initiation ATPase DnaA